MPSPGIISLARFSINGYKGWAYNLYYPVDTKLIILGKTEIRIVDVSPDRIRLSV